MSGDGACRGMCHVGHVKAVGSGHNVVSIRPTTLCPSRPQRCVHRSHNVVSIRATTLCPSGPQRWTQRCVPTTLCPSRPTTLCPSGPQRCVHRGHNVVSIRPTTLCPSGPQRCVPTTLCPSATRATTLCLSGQPRTWDPLACAGAKTRESGMTWLMLDPREETPGLSDHTEFTVLHITVYRDTGPEHHATTPWYNRIPDIRLGTTWDWARTHTRIHTVNVGPRDLRYTNHSISCAGRDVTDGAMVLTSERDVQQVS